MNIDLRLLRAFVTVAYTGNVGRAAQRLNISQSPLSRQVMQLEAQLGLTLFERARRRVHLTEQGRVFLAEAQSLLDHADRVSAQARRLGAGDEGQIAIGYVEAAMHSGVLPTAVARLRRERPAVEIALLPMRSADQATALLDRRIDLGLLHGAPDVADLAIAGLIDEPLMLALAQDHSLAARDQIVAADLDGAAWVALARNRHPEARQLFLDHCRDAGFAPTITAEAEDLVAVLQLVAAEVGLTFIQSSLCHAFQESLVFRAVPWFPHRVRVNAAWRLNDPGPLLAAVRRLLLDR